MGFVELEQGVPCEWRRYIRLYIELCLIFTIVQSVLVGWSSITSSPVFHWLHDGARVIASKRADSNLRACFL